jgi:hypothetical protein
VSASHWYCIVVLKLVMERVEIDRTLLFFFIFESDFSQVHHQMIAFVVKGAVEPTERSGTFKNLIYAYTS